MKKSKLYFILLAAFLSMFLSSCSAIAGIFKAGMGFGIFLVVVVVIVIIVLVARAGKDK